MHRTGTGPRVAPRVGLQRRGPVVGVVCRGDFLVRLVTGGGSLRPRLSGCDGGPGPGWRGGRVCPRGWVAYPRRRGERNALLAVNRNCLELRAAHVAILGHFWHPPDPTWQRVLADCDYGRRQLALWAALEPQGLTARDKSTKAGQPLGKWLYRILLYCSPAQAEWLVARQGGMVAPSLTAFPRSLSPNSKNWTPAPSSKHLRRRRRTFRASHSYPTSHEYQQLL